MENKEPEWINKKSLKELNESLGHQNLVFTKPMAVANKICVDSNNLESSTQKHQKLSLKLEFNIQR